MTKKLFVISVCICLSYMNESYGKKSFNTENRIIIVGKPYKVEDSPNAALFSNVSIGSKYIVYFKDYKVVSGKLERSRKVLKIEMTASSSSILTYPEEIYVIFNNSNDKILEALIWDIPKYSICLTTDIISDLGLHKEFEGLNENNGIKCKGIYSQ